MLTIIGSIVLTVCLAAVQAQGGLTFTAPDAWKPRPSSSAMRVAEYVLPRASGDAEDAEVVVYYFGGQGGSIEANIERWLGQVQQPDGRPSKAVAKRATRTVNGLEVTIVDVAGTYVAEVRPGAADRFNKPGFAMRAAVVQTPRGPYFIKMTGPAQTVAKWLPSVDGMLKTLAFKP